MTKMNVLASRWSGGWELEIDEDHHTQVATLAKARQQVVDYLDTIDEATDHSDWDIRIVPQIEAIGEIEEARRATSQATQAQAEAARLSRHVVRRLRGDGLSVSDIATVMGVSRGRVSQLVK
jgi:DNA-directed RNA polymerase specialized sigma24 family protein